ncbi:GNAT family N-acetyltransferase [Gammaproteobacteria bacterium]|nr:GNAT family N-acetyltransferase [SAR86 cluster bacterium]MDB3880932.1 GNAT family N-acetyltransferase [Gammaproteobacteria bacterium]MDB3975788.1 GNAT family N-acetyltransferase [Gammaproteobacteria bacterium]MDB3994338.1 GNAT family N-acetyltransferase [Gammaproteobacteria bacterium]MDC0509723.1 GNAT family N-acetyltransferase [Gammaproteobacteria bacterium]|tara:strand:- start:499 stop:972 length:474 start_codon:yes stop_codon:yes gene_type:complete
MDRLKIEPYDSKYKFDFEILNREWIEEYFEMEQEDLNILQNPEDYVIKKGGEVFFAILENRVVGTAAMVLTTMGVYELAKMAVNKDYQGMGIGRSLLQRSIKFALDENAREIFLITNDALKPALNLYHSSGFVLCPQNDDNRYLRGNTKMNLILGEK